MGLAPTGQRAKAYGAFYTDPVVADFLVWWALRSSSDTVIDPSFGGGVFLEAAAKRLQFMGGKASTQVYGIELDPEAHEAISGELTKTHGLSKRSLILSDFFDVGPATVGLFDAVVGNPPFIRYQSFSGTGREKALKRAAEQGVKLNNLSSSWAAFLVHSVGMLRRGGRLAMVIPMELGHAAYARPVVDFLQKSFRSVTLLTFKKRLFPELSQDTLLVLAEDKGGAFEGLRLRDLEDASDLVRLQEEGHLPLLGTRQVDISALSTGVDKLVTHFIPSRAADLYRELLASPQVKRLGDLAEAGIGYVSGANPFFHLSPGEVRAWELPKSLLRPAVFRGKPLVGLSFTLDDWRKAAEEGEAGYLFFVQQEKLSKSALAYIQHGEVQGVHESYKCRIRSPWYRVPHVYKPDAFLTYMSGLRPSLVANEADAVAPNTLHVVRLHPPTQLTGKALSALWQTSLTCLSVELEGHAMGGGMLKLEPTEAKRVVVPFPSVNGELTVLAEELDTIKRKHGDEAARQRANEVILKEMLGLTEQECQVLQEASESLRQRRYHRGAELRGYLGPQAKSASSRHKNDARLEN